MTSSGQPYNSPVKTHEENNHTPLPETHAVYGSLMAESQVVQIVFIAYLSGIVILIGLAANVLNIIIFWKQGFNDSVNISLCALSLSDMGALAPLLWTALCCNPLFEYSDIDFDSHQIRKISAGWPHGCFVRITSWITAFIAFERCVCIALPMKVKNIITSRRTFTFIVCIFIVITSSVIPVFFAVNIEPVFSIKRNKTLKQFSYIYNGHEIENMCSNINCFAELVAVLIVIICTAILTHKLIAVSLWRQKVKAFPSWHNSKSVSSRDMRVIKIVTSISSIFIVCFVPGTATFVFVTYMFPDYSLPVQFVNVYDIAWSVFNLLEVTNSSISILVYYNMSSKFRVIFYNLFRSDISKPPTLDVRELNCRCRMPCSK